MYFTPTSMSNNVAITVNSAGVTIDLNGFSLTGPPQVFIPDWYLNPAAIITGSNNVTIKNGSIIGFYVAVDASAESASYLNNIVVDFVKFTNFDLFALDFSLVNSSFVTNCVFSAPSTLNATCIIDQGSQTGNRYIDDTYSETDGPRIDTDFKGPIVFSIEPRTEASKN
jgi:hypothetical protein